MGGGFGGRAAGRRVRAPGTLAAGSNVFVLGLRSKQDHNGKMGCVQRFDAAAGRYVVDLSKGGGQISLRPDNVQQIVQATVTGLRGQAELNGTGGWIVGFDEKKGRQVVL